MHNIFNSYAAQSVLLILWGIVDGVRVSLRALRACFIGFNNMPQPWNRLDQ